MRVEVLGDGPLTAAIDAAASEAVPNGAGRLEDAATPAAAVLVARLDSLPTAGELAALCAGDRALLLVGHWRSRCFVGPVWLPGRPGCPHCLLTRVANSPYGPPQGPAPHTPVPGAEAYATAPGRGLAPAAIGIGAVLAVDALRGSAADRLLVRVVDGHDCTVVDQRLLPDSTCPACGTPARDAPPVLDADGAPRRKLTPTTLRAVAVDPDRLRAILLGPPLGLFKGLRLDLDCPVAASSVEQPARFGRREPAIGRAETWTEAQSVALLEGLERYAGLYRGGAPVAVRASYRDVAGSAVDPATLGLHPEESYATPGFRFRPFTDDVVVDWVTGVSMRTGGATLVPERSVYWGPRYDGEVAFAYETSNGCAVGASVEEAALHGLRELAERDALLLTWYRRLSLPEVDLDGAGHPRLAALLHKSELVTGCRFRAFHATMEYGMPSYVLVAEGRRSGAPAVVAGAAAHPDPIAALSAGLRELVGAVQYVQYHRAERRREALRMLADPSLVRRMEDHAAMHAEPQARDRFAFLLDTGGAPVPLASVPATVRADSEDIRDDFRQAVGGFLAAGLDVVLVDQTMPELRALGLVCVKVLVPGLVPMTFGHVNRRTSGLRRLSAAYPLPYEGGADGVEGAASAPHPFP